MTNQEKKAWLSRYTLLNKEIDRQLEEMARLRALCERMTPILSEAPMKSKGQTSTREDVYIRLADLAREINGMIDRYADMRAEIEKAITTIDDPTLRLLLKLRYIDGKTWEETAAVLEAPDNTVRGRLHSKALKAISTTSCKNIMAYLT